MRPTPRLRQALALVGACLMLVLALCLTPLSTSTTGNLSTAAPAPIRIREHSWPLWGGTVQRNLVNLADRNIAADWNSLPGKERNIKWSVQLGSRAAFGGPTIGGGKIFVGTNNNRPRDRAIRGDKGVLMCFEGRTGKFLWQIVRDKLPAGRVNDWPEEGIMSAAVVEGSRLWFVSNRCEVVCASTEGKVLWRLDMLKDLGVFPHNLATCSPLIVGDVLFVITSNGVDEGHINIPAPNAPSFLAVDKNKGKVVWSSKLPGRNIMHGQWSNPVYTVAQGQAQVIFPGGDGFLYSFEPKTGELLWKFDCNPKASKYRLGGKGTRSDFVSTPVIWQNKLYIGVGQDPEHKKGVGHLWCIDITRKPKNKDKDLSPVSPDDTETPSNFDPKGPRNKDSGLVWHYGGKIPKAKGEKKYFFGRTMSTCAVHDGLCFAADFDGTVFCFDANTGKKHWEHQMEDEDQSSDTWSSPYLVDGKVYIGNEDGVMHIFEASSKKKLLKTVPMKGKVRATPVALNGVLYVLTENPCKLWAIKAK